MQVIEVLYVVNGTTCTDKFTAQSSMHMIAGIESSTGSVLRMTGGKDEQGKAVKYKAYRQAETIQVWDI